MKHTINRNWNLITKFAQSDEGLNLHNTIAFHYFNPNGMYATRQRNDAEIAQLVDAGIINSGWHLSCGSLSDYETDQMRKMFQAKKLSKTEVVVWKKMMRDQIERTNTKLDYVRLGLTGDLVPANSYKLH